MDVRGARYAKTTLVLGNVGVVQARDVDSAVLAKLAADIGADALCVHMNAAHGADPARR